MSKMTKHHVIPRNPDNPPRFILWKKEKHHRAYHLLFGAPASFEAAVEILRRNWWTAENERHT